MISVLSDQYLARAAEADAHAERAELPRVRERFQHSAATWRAMAGQALLVETNRAEAARARAG